MQCTRKVSATCKELGHPNLLAKVQATVDNRWGVEQVEETAIAHWNEIRQTAPEKDNEVRISSHRTVTAVALPGTLKLNMDNSWYESKGKGAFGVGLKIGEANGSWVTVTSSHTPQVYKLKSGPTIVA
ncbi:hypothetical protein RHSIM_Rhsim12G0053600 [Rhododendron simsii]|uniref:Uncharacterized protein n=1 Tax=Rhododendron simsii TaxID=118357 RepID=A0A834L7Z6_RHOSS|nr:hypothetical protein RHSIM_Rhsim12G0053600 [Rhododendron simsii]